MDDDKNNDNTLLQQLLIRLRQAHESIDLDPIQGQFLLDASGGDLDLAVGLYWEDSVAHHAVASSSHTSNNNQHDAGAGAGAGAGTGAGARTSNRRKRQQKENNSDDDDDDSFDRGHSKDTDVFNHNDSLSLDNNAAVAAIRIKEKEPSDESKFDFLLNDVGVGSKSNEVAEALSSLKPSEQNHLQAFFRDVSKGIEKQNKSYSSDKEGSHRWKVKYEPTKKNGKQKIVQVKKEKGVKSDDEAKINEEEEEEKRLFEAAIMLAAGRNNNRRDDNNNEDQPLPVAAAAAAAGNQLQRPRRHIPEADSMVASNISDDEAAAIAERIWKQIKPNVTHSCYKAAIQKQIKRMTRRRKKKRIKSSGHDIDIELGVGSSDDMEGRERSTDSTKNKKKKRRVQKLKSSMFKRHESDVDDNSSSDENAKPSAASKKDYKSDVNKLKNILNCAKDKGLKEMSFEELDSVINNNDNSNSNGNNSCKMRRKSNNGDIFMSDVHDDSDLEKVNIDDLKDAFNLSKIEVVTPSMILWGHMEYSDDSDDDNGDDAQQQQQLLQQRNENNDNAQNRRGIENNEDNENNHGDVIMKEETDNQNEKDGLDVVSNGDANEDDDDDEDEDDDLDEAESSKSADGFFHAIIPTTWLSAGFELSPCGTGLVLPRPVGTELARLRRIQSTRFSRATSSLQPPLPPYHCGGMTVLLSIVTALLYTGASIQGNEVNCKACRRKPFADLSLDERKKEFPERLIDALAALLFIVAKESTKHRSETLADIEKRLCKKRKMFRQRKMTTGYDSDDDWDSSTNGRDIPDEDSEIMMNQLMQHRLQLCQVCHWEEDKNSKELKVPLDTLVQNRLLLQFSVTMTNAKDLKSFVLSNLRSFMSPGKFVVK